MRGRWDGDMRQKSDFYGANPDSSHCVGGLLQHAQIYLILLTTHFLTLPTLHTKTKIFYKLN